MDGEGRQRIQQRLIAELATDRNVAFAYLYASFVESQPFHDIDVGVYIERFLAGQDALDIACYRLLVAISAAIVRFLQFAPSRRDCRALESDGAGAETPGPAT